MASAAFSALAAWAWPPPPPPKPPQRTKMAATYEALFAGQPVAGHVACAARDVLRDDWAPPRFWDEMLLLKVDAPFLLRALGERSPEALLVIAAPVSELTCVCCRYCEDRNLLRIAHALETLALVFHALSRQRFPSRGLGLLNVAAGGAGNADALFRRLLPTCAALSEREDVALAVRAAALRLLCVLAAAAPNINANVVAAYFMEFEIYDPLLRLLHGREAAAASLRGAAAVLLAVLLTWRESRNAYCARLASAPPAQLVTLLTTAARLLSPPPGERLSAQTADTAAAAAALAAASAPPTAALSDVAAAAADYVAEYLFAASSAWSAATAPPPDTLLDSLAASLGYPPLPACDAAAVVPPLTWQARPAAAAGAALLHALAAHSALLRCDGAWISAAAGGSRRGSAAVGALWHECLGRLLCHAARLARAPPAPDAATQVAQALAPATLLLHLSTLRLLVEDPKSADFAAGTDVARLRGTVGTTSEDAAAAATSADDSSSVVGVSGGGAGGTAQSPARSVAAAMLELCAEVLQRGGPGGGGGAGESAAAAESVAAYLAHRVLHSHAARGGAPLPLHRGWVALWRGALASLSRAAQPGALGRPLRGRTAAQCLNLLSFALAAGPTLLPSPGDAQALVAALVSARADTLRLGGAAAAAGLLDPADVASLTLPPPPPPDTSAAPPVADATSSAAGSDSGGSRASSPLPPHAGSPAHRLSSASLRSDAPPLLRMRPLLDVFAAFGDVAPDKLPRVIKDRAGLLPRVTLERLDAGYAAGAAPSDAAAAALTSLGRGLVAAAAPSAAALAAHTGALDASLGSTRAGAAAPDTPRMSSGGAAGAAPLTPRISVGLREPQLRL